MARVREQFERYWNDEVDPEVEHPFRPLLALEEVADDVAFVSSFANATAVRTGDGLVLVDTGSFFLAAQAKAAIRGWSRERVSHAIFTHGHVDHCFGVELYEEERKVHVIAHEAVPARFDRYLRTRGWNACINMRQFSGSRDGAFEWPTSFRYPDETFRDALDRTIGDLRFELRHARGETDDATWVFLPERKVALVGDLFIWASPNAGNPQKVQRYALDWARALRAVRACAPEVLVPGHGPPIWGADRVSRALDETAALLESLHDQTVALMNEGARLDTILAEVRAPSHLLERPYLRPIYDEPEFVVRNVVRLYGGWWDGNPAHLKPARDAELAREIAALSGGSARLIERAEALVAQGNFPLACHLAELAAQASPDDEGIFAARARVYEARAKTERSLMARGVYLTAARERPSR